MKKMERFNNSANYCDTAFDFGFRKDKLPNKPVYTACEGEEVLVTVLPFDATPIEEIEQKFDDVDFAMIEEIARSKYLSSLQVYQFVRLRGLQVQRAGSDRRLKKMMRLRVIREYEIKAPDASRGLKAYDLDFKGFRIACKRGIAFHKGNQYISSRRKQELELFDTAENMKRILVGNMIVLADLMNGAAFGRFGIMETMRPAQELPVTDGCILRTAANIQLDEESILLYEVVRSTPHSMRKLADKVTRYYILANDPRYRECNYYGHAAVPQLVICGESYEHCVKIDQYLRSKGLINEKDSLLYTEDLLYVQRTLQNLYELDEDGHRTWYSLPERQNVTKTEIEMERSA